MFPCLVPCNLIKVGLAFLSNIKVRAEQRELPDQCLLDVKENNEHILSLLDCFCLFLSKAERNFSVVSKHRRKREILTYCCLFSTVQFIGVEKSRDRSQCLPSFM